MAFVSQTYKTYDILGDSEGVQVWVGSHFLTEVDSLPAAIRFIDDRRREGWGHTVKGDPTACIEP